MKKFERLRHIRYFSNSLRNLPKQYSSADTNRITLVYFSVQALDILGCIPDAGCCGKVDEEIYLLREEIIEWIYGLQTLPTLVVNKPPGRSEDDGRRSGESSSSSSSSSDTASGSYVGGGFKGGTYLGPLPNASGVSINNDDENDDTQQQQQQPSPIEQLQQHPYDHSHIAMTYVAICTLLTLGDDLSRIHKTAILQTLKALQKEDGSFVAISSNNRNTESATSPAGEGEEKPIVEEKVDDDCDLRFMYLTIAIWYLLTDQNSNSSNNNDDDDEDPYINIQSATSYILSCISYDGSIGLTPGREGHGGSTFCGTASLHLLGTLDASMARRELRGWKEDLIRWCVMRQRSLPKRDEKENEEERTSQNGYYYHDWDKYAAGMQGRPNKLQDTCYSYWIGGTLHMMNESHVLDGWALRDYVLTCQSPYGGFGKVVGANPDLLHSFYALCWLAMSRDQGCCEEEYDDEDDNDGEERICGSIESNDSGGKKFSGHDGEIKEQVHESLGRLSQLDCALGICTKRIPGFPKAVMNGND